jgi:ATP-dependent protease ClpP protease subunit
MGYQTRTDLYNEFENIRKKPLITYVTSIRANVQSQMSSDAIPQIIEQVNAISNDSHDVDFLIISNGGDPIAAQRIISILRERFKRISVILPYVAYSAATVLALGADEIVMHPYSNLGPIDPQMSIIKPNNMGQQSQLQFSSEDIRNYIEFIRSDVGITDQAQMITAFNTLAAEVGAIPIGSSKRSQQLLLSLSEKMLETHMGSDNNKAASIAKTLNTSYYHHGYPVGRQEAKKIGLDIVFPDQNMESLMWAIWLDFCAEMKCNQAFDPIAEIMDDPIAKSLLSTYPVISLPANTPTQIGQSIIGQMAQQMATQAVQLQPIEIVYPVATIESSRQAYVFNNTLNIAYWREANMSLSYNMIAYSKGWTKL